MSSDRALNQPPRIGQHKRRPPREPSRARRDRHAIDDAVLHPRARGSLLPRFAVETERRAIRRGPRRLAHVERDGLTGPDAFEFEIPPRLPPAPRIRRRPHVNDPAGLIDLFHRRRAAGKITHDAQALSRAVNRGTTDERSTEQRRRDEANQLNRNCPERYREGEARRPWARDLHLGRVMSNTPWSCALEKV